VLEEAAYVDPGFFYETVAPLMLIGTTSLIAISTLREEVNFYTRLMRMRDPVTGMPLFRTISVQLACKKCIDDGKSTECVHMLHLVPRWQSSDRHMKLKTVMQDRPDLIESELSGLAFDSNHQIFKSAHIQTMFEQDPPRPVLNEAVFIFIDPAGGGPQSDYAVLSVTRQKGLLTVRVFFSGGSAAQVGLPQPVHEVRGADPLVLDPHGDQLVVEGVVETLGLVRAQPSHRGRVQGREPGPHALVLVQQHEELDLQAVQRVPLRRPERLQRVDHALARVLGRDVDHGFFHEPPDVVQVRPVEHVK
jgi:hypothetical protein